MVSSSDTPNQKRAPHLLGVQICSSVFMPHVLGWVFQVIRSAGAYLRNKCFTETITEIKADGNSLFPVSCYCSCLIEGLTPNAVSSQQIELQKKTKEQENIKGNLNAICLVSVQGSYSHSVAKG